MTRRRVVITGLGLISPVGNTVAEGWANILAGQSGIDRITRFDPSAFACQFAGEVKGFKIEDYIPAAKPEVLFDQTDDGLVLEARVPAELLPAVPAGSDLQVSLAAVVERKDGMLEYWALRHAAAQPDFHARDTFVLTLGTATHKAD